MTITDESNRITSESNIINKQGRKVDFNKFLEYHSIILPYLKVPEDYCLKDKFLPWSFGQNKIQNFEIEQSSVYFQYKNNK